MKQRVAALGLLLALTCAGAAAQDKMSLKKAVDLVLNNNQQVQIAAENVAGAEFKIDENKSQYLPQLNVTGNYTRMSLFGEFSIPFNGEIMTIKFGTPNNYNFRASVMEQVFNWGRTARTVDISKSGLDLANDGVALTKHMLSYQIVPLFYGTVFFREADKVLDETLKAYEKKLETAKQRYDAGLASSFDVDLLQVQISTVRGQRLDFLNSIEKFRIAFNTLTGRDPSAAFDPDGVFVFEPAAFNAEALLREALENRVEFQQWRHQVDLNKASIELAKTGDKPTVTASFNYEFRNGFMPEIDKIKGNWTAALSMNYPVFDGFRVRAQVAEAQSGLKAVELHKIDLERSVYQEIQTALADLKVAEQKLDIEKIKIKQAEDSLRIAEERFRNGLLSATELIDAQNAVENARLNALQLVYGHTLGKFTLYRSCGRKI
ncbi:MAG: TolC family protein [Candidatus Aminicenantes bacterium]|nr:TolC family protein [Candidatus Aminicenantes bacterium]